MINLSRVLVFFIVNGGCSEKISLHGDTSVLEPGICALYDRECVIEFDVRTTVRVRTKVH